MPIRMASLDDIDTLVEARFAYFAAEGWEVSPAQQERIEANLCAYYLAHMNVDFFAAFVEEQGEVASVAFLAVSARPANPSFPTGKVGMILNVLTYAKHRRKGYATQAMEALIGEARNQNLSYIELSASPAGRPLYERLGFVKALKSEHFTDMKLSLL